MPRIVYQSKDPVLQHCLNAVLFPSHCPYLSHTPKHDVFLSHYYFTFLLRVILKLIKTPRSPFVGFNKLKVKILPFAFEPMTLQYAILNAILFVFLRSSNCLNCPTWCSGPIQYWWYLPIFCFQEISLPHFSFLCHVH